jgi:hypothetical protein
MVPSRSLYPLHRGSGVVFNNEWEGINIAPGVQFTRCGEPNNRPTIPNAIQFMVLWGVVYSWVYHTNHYKYM